MHRKIFIITVLALSFFAPLYADYYMIPIPPATREVKQEKAQMAGTEFTITIYASELSFSEIAKFYRQRLTAQGWEDVANNEKVKDLVKSDFFTQALIFKKEDEMLNIQNLPSANPQETVFSLSRGNIQVLKTGEPQVSEVELRDIPLYPNATAAPLSSMRTPTKEQVGYTTIDTIERVMQFYREKLPVYGWSIESELPLSDYGSAESLANCPGCEKLPAETREKLKGSAMKMAALNATKEGKSCYIGATEMSLADGLSPETVISISCSR